MKRRFDRGWLATAASVGLEALRLELAFAGAQPGSSEGQSSSYFVRIAIG